MSRCDAIRERLADDGLAQACRDAAIAEHLAACRACSAFARALEQVDAGLSELPELPAPDAAVARALDAVAGNATPPAKATAADAGARKLATALAATVILTAGFGLVTSVQDEASLGLYARNYAGSLGDDRSIEYRQRRVPGVEAIVEATVEALAPAQAPRAVPEPEPPADQSTTGGIVAESAPVPAAPSSSSVRSPQEIPLMESTELAFANEGAASAAPPSKQQSKEQKKRDRQLAGQKMPGTVGGAEELRRNAPAGEALAGERFARADDDGMTAGFGDRVAELLAHAAQPADLPTADEETEPQREAARRKSSELQASLDRLQAAEFEKNVEASNRALEPPVEEPARARERDDGRGQLGLAAPGKAGRLADAKDKLERRVASARSEPPLDGPRIAARRFLAERERLTDLDFQSASGYWANTYVPGDPAIRLLEARLQRWDRRTLHASIGDADLEAAAHQNRQPFDLPENAALAAYLHADKRAVNGRSRMRVQVGLQASEKRSGLRPDMNVGVVLDMRRPLDEATGARVRALVAALARTRQPGDRFSITVAGHPGGLLVAPEQFRHGPIRIAMQSLFAPATGDRAQALDLLAALATASDNVRQGDDTSAPLGASLVLLVSTAPLAEQRATLERMAHENAIAGIALSVVAAGGGADLATVDRLVLLGQGHRRVLTAAEDATKLVDRELHAASRAVARAVRLRIRLAPGVELVDVLGSRNLSEQAAQRVRDAERSIDRRVARNIGIRADRGEDEEGIQIVIPSFFAGDSHSVLLDVVVPGPGPVADVSVRYKDLVYRRNGVARARLAVQDGHLVPAPLERNVFKDQLAHEIARAAVTAGRQLGAGDRQEAARTLSRARDLLIGLRHEIPGWDSDNELRGDEALLAQYLKALQSSHMQAGSQQQHLVDSLRYVAFRRLIPPYK